MVSSKDACNIINEITALGIRIWLDGGWGVDALLGIQTREHNDIDILVQNKDRTKLLELIRRNGFSEVIESYTTANHSVWQDTHGKVLDLHFIDFDPAGNVHFEGDSFPGEVLNGIGLIDGCQVECINAWSQVQFHCGYAHDNDDLADVTALCRKFDIPIPPQYIEENG